MGVAYYDVDTAYLYIMPDVAEAEDLGLLYRGEEFLSERIVDMRRKSIQLHILSYKPSNMI